MSLTLPNLVITAPDGSSLWIDPVSALRDDGSPSLWPAGYSVRLAQGPLPVTGTIDPEAFLMAQLPTLLRSGGPLGVEWGIWLLLLGAGLTFAIIKLRR